jgi:ketosteroid isomerase-like protein
MPIDDRHRTSESPILTPRGKAMFAILISAVIVAVVSTVVWHSDSPATGSPPLSASSRAVTTTSLMEKDQVEVRLRDILKVRDQAYRRRNVQLLRQIYTADCPCLQGDGAAIRQLLEDDAVWVGASTSVRIKKLEKVSDRVWVIVANFDASPFRIETESGTLIRAVEGRTELFRFVPAKNSTGSSLQLGYAAAVD